MSDPENEAPTRVQPSAFDEAEPLPAWDLESDPKAAQAAKALPPPVAPGQLRPQSSMPAPATYSAPPAAPSYAEIRPKKSKLGLVIGLGAVAALGVLAVGGLVAASFLTEDADSAETPSAAAPATSPEVAPIENAASASKTACTVKTKAKKIAEGVSLRVPVVMTPISGDRVYAGFAAGKTEALIYKLNPNTLASKKLASYQKGNNVTSVVPFKSSGELKFKIDREEAALQSARTVEHEPPFTLGLNGEDLVKRTGSEVVTLWKAGKKITTPRLASSETGHVLTFRRNGQGGQIMVGWLSPDGQSRGRPVAIGSDAVRLGTPNVAARDDVALVSFAGKTEGAEKWSLFLAKAEAGKSDAKAKSFELPSGGPGEEAISPTATPLPGQRWLLQWTEGPAGKRTVRALTLDSELAPLGSAIALAPESVQAGQGSLAQVGESAALSTFLVKQGASYELWGTSLSCAD